MAMIGIVERLVNPSTRNYEWSGRNRDDEDKKIPFKNRISYWDREKEERVIAPAPKGIPLAISLSLNGFDQTENTGVWSTEVFVGDWNTAMSSPATISKGKKIVDSGSFKELKERHGAVAKMRAHLYLYDVETKQIVRLLSAKSGSLSSEILGLMFGDNAQVGKNWSGKLLTISGEQEGKTGTTIYQKPVITAERDLTEEEDKIQTELSKSVYDYLTLSAPAIGTVVENKEEETVAEVAEPIDLSEVPF